jgi:hypothetical protein
MSASQFFLLNINTSRVAPPTTANTMTKIAEVSSAAWTVPKRLSSPVLAMAPRRRSSSLSSVSLGSQGSQDSDDSDLVLVSENGPASTEDYALSDDDDDDYYSLSSSSSSCSGSGSHLYSGDEPAFKTEPAHTQSSPDEFPAPAKGEPGPSSLDSEEGGVPTLKAEAEEVFFKKADKYMTNYQEKARLRRTVEDEASPTEDIHRRVASAETVNGRTVWEEQMGKKSTALGASHNRVKKEEGKARLEAESKARLEALEKARMAAMQKARIEAEYKARKEAECRENKREARVSSPAPVQVSGSVQGESVPKGVPGRFLAAPWPTHNASPVRPLAARSWNPLPERPPSVQARALPVAKRIIMVTPPAPFPQEILVGPVGLPLSNLPGIPSPFLPIVARDSAGQWWLRRDPRIPPLPVNISELRARYPHDAECWCRHCRKGDLEKMSYVEICQRDQMWTERVYREACQQQQYLQQRQLQITSTPAPIPTPMSMPQMVQQQSTPPAPSPFSLSINPRAPQHTAAAAQPAPVASNERAGLVTDIKVLEGAIHLAVTKLEPEIEPFMWTKWESTLKSKMKILRQSRNIAQLNENMELIRQSLIAINATSGPWDRQRHENTAKIKGLLKSVPSPLADRSVAIEVPPHSESPAPRRSTDRPLRHHAVQLRPLDQEKEENKPHSVVKAEAKSESGEAEATMMQKLTAAFQKV